MIPKAFDRAKQTSELQFPYTCAAALFPLSRYPYGEMANANFHASTTINGVTYTYDNNGPYLRGLSKIHLGLPERPDLAGQRQHEINVRLRLSKPACPQGLRHATTTCPNKYMSNTQATTTTKVIWAVPSPPKSRSQARLVPAAERRRR
jgi:hypothetical protein